MKKFFTLCVVAVFSLTANRISAQINENFENGLAPLAANCWQFTNMMYATAPSGFAIAGGGSPYSEPPVSTDSVRIMRTPFLWVENTIDVSFIYKLSNNLNGQSSRFIKIDLVDDAGNVAQVLDSFQVTNIATVSTQYAQVFAVNVPGAYRLSITMGGSTGGGNVRLSLDNLSTSMYELGCTARTLPIHLMSFQGNMNKNNKVTLTWKVADNENANSFEIERSTNGRDFTTIGVVFASENIGTQNYTFYETYTGSDRVMYRLKMIDKNREIDYSKILVFSTKSISSSEIKIYGNPVKDQLTLSYSSNANQIVDVKVYDIAGKNLMSQKINSAEGNNLLNLPLNSTFKAGMYVVTVSNGTDIQTAKFVKQ